MLMFGRACTGWENRGGMWQGRLGEVWRDAAVTGLDGRGRRSKARTGAARSELAGLD
jgi:hypothetical protein